MDHKFMDCVARSQSEATIATLIRANGHGFRVTLLLSSGQSIIGDIDQVSTDDRFVSLNIPGGRHAIFAAEAIIGFTFDEGGSE